MCGLGGIVRPGPGGEIDPAALRRMARALWHRGPDGHGLATGDGAALVSTRLAIFDVPGGWQPMGTDSGRSYVVYNGEVYNHPELREELRADGGFRTTTDTEVVLRLLDRDGLAALHRLNGQFAIAWWQPRERRLTLVRDRFGVRPLHFSLLEDGGIVFASEVKGILATGEVDAAPDLVGVDDVFTLWGPRAPVSPFAGIEQVPPGGVVVWERGRIVERSTWWEPDYSPRGEEPGELDALMRDSVRLRLRADVPVGTYLSGGLDSSLITALAQEASDFPLHTFSVAFTEASLDERRHQEEVAGALGVQHHRLEVGSGDIAEAFPDVVAHAETPLIRSAPVPLYLLAETTRQQGITVVATGEGADELFWGYDLFKETVLRARAVHDETALDDLAALYPYLAGDAARRGPGWARAFTDAGDHDDPLFSHQARAVATSAVKAFYRPEVAEAVAEGSSLQRLRDALPPGFACWTPLERAAYLEVRTLLEPYLLAAQGDRVAMAHGVEGRYPFLDHRVFEHTVRLRAERKLDGSHDKVELRELAHTVLPRGIADRPKQPYRAPEVAPFFGDHAPDWVEDLLGETALRRTGVFDERRVAGLVRRCRAGRAGGVREGMALVGVLSTQVWHEIFCGDLRRTYEEETREPRVVLDMTLTKEASR